MAVDVTIGVVVGVTSIALEFDKAGWYCCHRKASKKKSSLSLEMEQSRTSPLAIHNKPFSVVSYRDPDSSSIESLFEVNDRKIMTFNKVRRATSERDATTAPDHPSQENPYAIGQTVSDSIFYSSTCLNGAAGSDVSLLLVLCLRYTRNMCTPPGPLSRSHQTPCLSYLVC